jgi:hypothetical protein
MARRAAAMIRWAFATLVPPNFCTTNRNDDSPYNNSQLVSDASQKRPRNASAKRR